MSRAILADAIALVRGDRYLTYDLTPYSMLMSLNNLVRMPNIRQI